VILSWISLNCRRWSGRAKKCALCDQCGQCGRPLSAGGRQPVCTVWRDERQTPHAGKQSTVRSGRTVAYITTSAHDRIIHGKQWYYVSQLLTVPLLLTAQCTVLPTHRPPHVSATCQCQLTVAAASHKLLFTVLLQYCNMA